jgi:SAM-dependent methyltransferase
MKRCLTCDISYDSSLSNCPNCDSSPDLIEGFDAYAKEFARAGGGFKAGYFSELARLEDTNFWFRARNELILWMLGKYCQDFQSFLEIGCGTGYVLSGVAKRFPEAKLHGSEIFVSGLEYAASRLPSANLMQVDARNIPFENEFDVIGAFDVLEHIEEDETVLAQMHNALNPKGFMLLAVPQHPWLWSTTDEYACHVRRYVASDLHKKVESAGFRIIRSTSFVTTILPAMIVSRFSKKKVSTQKFDASTEMKISPWLNSLFYKMLSAELWAIKRELNFPVGGSRLVVAEKIESK